MSLGDDLAAIPRHGIGKRCTVGQLLDPDITPLDDDDRATLAAAIDDHRIKGTDIARVLEAHGYRMQSVTLNRHRRGDCNCEAV